MGTAILMIKTQIGLGVLSIPTVFNVLGIVPGVICLIAVATITTWSDYIVGVFKINHPAVYGIDDAGKLMFGTIGKHVLGTAFCLCKFKSFNGSLSMSLISWFRLDLRRRLRNARYLYRSQCGFSPWSMHSCFCSCRCPGRI